VSEPVPAPGSREAVTRAEQALAAAEAALSEAREHHKQCRAEYKVVVEPLYREVDGKRVLVGSFHPDDEIFQAVLFDVLASTRDYGLAWERRVQTREHLKQAVQAYERAQRETYVVTHHGGLVEERDKLAKPRRPEESIWEAADRKQKHERAREAYRQAVDAAPVNGHRAP
jgi:hypothetical protein